MLPGDRALLAAEQMPPADRSRIDEDAEMRVGAAFTTVRALRNWRESVDAKPGLVINARLDAGHDDVVPELLARLGRLEWRDGGADIARVPFARGAVTVLETDGVDVAAADGCRTVQERRHDSADGAAGGGRRQDRDATAAG